MKAQRVKLGDGALRRLLGSALAGRSDSPCPTSAALVELAAAGASGVATEHIDLHLASCLDCATELEGLMAVERSAGRPPRSADARARRPSLAERLRALASPLLPLDLAVATRGVEASAARELPAAALAAYRAGRLGAARRLLRAARGRGLDSPELCFYLGACELGSGRAAAAARELTAAVRGEPSVPVYRWYLAQAWLRAGHGARALAELEAAVRLRGPQSAPARRLAARLKTAMHPQDAWPRLRSGSRRTASKRNKKGENP